MSCIVVFYLAPASPSPVHCLLSVKMCMYYMRCAVQILGLNCSMLLQLSSSSEHLAWEKLLAKDQEMPAWSWNTEVLGGRWIVNEHNILHHQLATKWRSGHSILQPQLFESALWINSFRKPHTEDPWQRPLNLHFSGYGFTEISRRIPAVVLGSRTSMSMAVNL